MVFHDAGKPVGPRHGFSCRDRDAGHKVMSKIRRPPNVLGRTGILLSIFACLLTMDMASTTRLIRCRPPHRNRGNVRSLCLRRQPSTAHRMYRMNHTPAVFPSFSRTGRQFNKEIPDTDQDVKKLKAGIIVHQESSLLKTIQTTVFSSNPIF